MMMDTKNDNLDFFDSEQKAIYHALWLNFKYRIAHIEFGVIQTANNRFAVLEEIIACERETPFLDILPTNLSEINYRQIRHIRMDKESLPHLEEITGMFSVMSGEILRYLLHTKLPLEKLIRFELAGRGYDKNHRWVGFDKANDIWLKDV